MARRKVKTLETGDHKIGQDKSVVIPATGKVKDIKRTDQIIDVIEGPDIKARIELEAFMNEIVEVTVAESNDQNADNPVLVACNGVPQYFIRGRQQPVKRKFVEILARAKQTSVRTVEFTDATGARAIRIDKSTALRYPFMINNDPNPNGMPWLRKILAEA